jgi:ABC-type antimicrobial peptide transport system permease subunit
MSLWRKLKRNPVRLLLTFLQILLGSLAMTLALSPYFTPKDSSREDVFFLSSVLLPKDGSEVGRVMNYKFKASDFDTLKTLTPDVEEVAIYDTGFGETNMVYEGRRFAFNFDAAVTVDLNYFAITPVVVTRGSGFSQAEAQAKEPVVLLSEGSAKKIFGDINPVGQFLLKVPARDFYSQQDETTYTPVSYRVIGTFADSKETLDTSVGIFFPLWAPETFYGDIGSSQLIVKAKAGRSEQAREQIVAVVRNFYEKTPGYETGGFYEDFLTSNSVDYTRDETPFNPNLIILGLFGIVSLVIGSVGLFSTMLVEVLGRSYDIGVKRALGASRLDICKEFATEAATLALLGSVAGVTLSALVISQLSGPLGETFFYGLRFVWQPLAALLVLGVAVSLGGLLGFFPALRATLAKPVEALRSI